MIDGMLIGLGAILVALVLLDVFLTVLYSRAGVGLLAPLLYQVTWRVLKAVGRFAKRHKNAVLAFSGPVMMVLTAMMWFLLLLLGFSLMVWPALGGAITQSSGTTPTGWWSAVYYTGYSLTTLGTGDLVPRTDPYRLLMVLKALVGFTIVTLTLTYFMAVYSALVRRNKLAQALHHLSGGTGDAVNLLLHVQKSGWFENGQGSFMDVGTQTLDLLESHHSYPVLHYFRMRDPRYSMARMAVLVLQPLTLARSALGDVEEDLGRHAEARMLWGSGIDLLRQTRQSLLDERAIERGDPAGDGHFQDAWRRLREAGLDLVDDRGKAEAAYVSLRGEWIGTVRAYAELMGHRWSEIEPGQEAGQGEH